MYRGKLVLDQGGLDLMLSSGLVPEVELRRALARDGDGTV